MKFQIFTDGSANLPKSMLSDITLLPCSYHVGEKEYTYLGDVDDFDGTAYYNELRAGKVIKTSLLNTHLFLTHFTPVLESGMDIIYIAMASGISGTYHAACLAAKELMEEHPGRTVRIVDSRGCGFGSGLLAYKGAELARRDLSANEAADILDGDVPHMCQYFTVDDLNFLKRSGRVSGATAVIGTVLNIKPILYGTAEGKIVSCAKVRGRKKAIDYLAGMYAKKVEHPETQTVCISHGDCLGDAQLLAEKVRAAGLPKNLIICQHEPFSGAHVGPGMLGLFFYGSER